MRRRSARQPGQRPASPKRLHSPGQNRNEKNQNSGRDFYAAFQKITGSASGLFFVSVNPYARTPDQLPEKTGFLRRFSDHRQSDSRHEDHAEIPGCEPFTRMTGNRAEKYDFKCHFSAGWHPEKRTASRYWLLLMNPICAMALSLHPAPKVTAVNRQWLSVCFWLASCFIWFLEISTFPEKQRRIMENNVDI